MQRVSNGYTIVEVMIFLAVSAALLGAATKLIGGKSSETQFNQKMRDTQSKIQDWLNDVATGDTGGSPGQQSCAIASNGRPYVKPTPPPAPPAVYLPSCTFLGKVIQFTDQSFGGNQDETLYAYSVFGCRIVSCAASGDYPDSLSNSVPEAAVGQNIPGGGNAVDLTDSFSLSPAYVKSVGGNVANSHMLGFFTSFNTEATVTASQNGSSDLNLYEYNVGNTAPANAGGGRAQNCMELNGCTATNLTNYHFCLSDGIRTAQISITSTNGTGASTKLDYIAC